MTALGVTLVGVGAALAGCGGTGEHDAHADGPASVSSSAGSGPYAGRELNQPAPRPAFVLIDQNGAAFDFAQRTSGQPTLLFFGYANCPDVCPTTMADVALALREVPADVATRTQVVFVTTDPVRDTAESLRAYLARFDADLPNDFVGLTGTVAEVEAAQDEAGVPLAEAEGTMHATSLFLYGADDVARVTFSAGDTATEIAHDLGVVATSR